MAIVSHYFSISVIREMLDSWTDITSCYERSLWEA